MGMNDTPSSERLHIGFFGRRNAGKSSVVNAVTNQNMSLVSDKKGTTTDPVEKTMELLPLGPVVIIDTAGFDDGGTLGTMRVERTKVVLNRVDIAVLVVDGTIGMTSVENELVSLFAEKKIPYLIVFNKCDLLDNTTDGKIFVSAKNNTNIELLKDKIAKVVNAQKSDKRLCGDLVNKNDFVVLVIPIDSAAPKGRIILPQQQVIRDLLDSGAIPVCVRESELADTLKNLGTKPKLVITDSQVFKPVSEIVPNDIKLTSFSILMARYKGFLKTAVNGARAIESLNDGDKLPDIFGQGVEIDNSEVVQTARRAKELLDKLAEYKPLAKIEELEEQNYNMIDGIINNLPPDATMNDRANALIDFVEKDGQRLGDGERRLIVYYAEQVQDTGKLAALVDELAGTGYEQEHGQLNYLVKSRVEAEAAAADAQHQKDGPLPPEHDPAVQPVVTVIWSENAALHNGQKMPLAEADALFKQLDAVPREPGQYEKTSFRIDFTFNGALDSYEGRQDFGDGDGGLIDHIQSYREFYAKDEQWKDYVLRNDGPEALEKDTAQRETALTEFVPYLRLHCNLTQMERAADDVLAVVAKIEEPDGLDRTNAAYYGAVQAYVTECRGQLNTGAYQLPAAPKKEDFIDPEYQAYREQVREEVKQEAAAAGLTVEQYAANGYEPRSSSQPVQEPTGTPAMDAIEAKVQRGEAVSLMAMVDAAKSDRAAGRAGKKPSVHDTLEAAKKAPAKPRKPRTKKAPAKDGPERS